MPRFFVQGNASDGHQRMTVEAADAEAARQVAEQHGVSVLKLWPADDDEPDDGPLYYTDAPAAKGQPGDVVLAASLFVGVALILIAGLVVLGVVASGTVAFIDTLLLATLTAGLGVLIVLLGHIATLLRRLLAVSDR